MSDEGRHEIELNEQQLDVVDASADARLLVIAGLGKARPKSSSVGSTAWCATRV